MPSYINKWFEIINGMSNTNTYKLAWGRSIVEHTLRLKDINLSDRVTISFDDMAIGMIKYYWNQTFFFDLRQTSTRADSPLIYQKITEIIDWYQGEFGNIPEWFDKAVTRIPEDTLTRLIKEVSVILKKDVSWRFSNVNGQTLDIYELDIQKKEISINTADALELAEFGEVIIQLLNYKWAQLLEQYNTSPRIASKVKGLSDSKIRRKSLTNYRDILMKLHDNVVLDFYTNEPIDFNDISIDHFIPWSYMYSDDLWNLVITSKTNNSSKSNRVPKKELIEKLEKRNEELIKIIDDDKLRNELILSLEHHYIVSFYMNLIG